MTKPFFVMVYTQRDEGAFPICEENDEVKFWATEDEAREAANNNYVAEKLGFDIFEMGAGL